MLTHIQVLTLDSAFVWSNYADVWWVTTPAGSLVATTLTCTDTVSNVTASLSCELMVVPGQCGTLGQPVLTARPQSDCCSTFSASIRWISQKSRPSIPLPSHYWSSASVITWPSTNLQSSSGECCATDSVDIPRTLACNALKRWSVLIRDAYTVRS